jgi:uncharacterized delta-60 repeat protein
LIGGRFTLVDQQPYAGIARLNSDGSLDRTFSAPGVTDGPYPIMLFAPTLAYVSSIVLQPDGKILIAGPFQHVNGVARSCIARLAPSGALDPTFAPGEGLLPGSGKVLLNTTYQLALAPNGDVIAQGNFTEAFKTGTMRTGLARFKSDGHLDESFNPVFLPDDWAAHPLSIAPGSEGALLVTGGFTNVNSVARSHIVRLLADGSVDTSFQPILIPDEIVKLIVQDNGKPILFGTFKSINGVSRTEIARLNSHGAIDPHFDPGTGPDDGNGSISAVAVAPSGAVFVAGSFKRFDGASRDAIALLMAADSSSPRLVIARSLPGVIQISVLTVPGKTYRLELTESLASTSPWNLAESFDGDGSTHTFEQAATDAERYFRLRISE